MGGDVPCYAISSLGSGKDRQLGDDKDKWTDQEDGQIGDQSL